MPRNPWDRLDGETDFQWQAFQAFMALERPRRLRDLSRSNKKLVYGSLRQWSSRHRWYARAAALDELADKGLTEAMVTSKMRIKIKQQQILEDAGDLVAKTFERLKKQALEGVGPGARINARDAVAMLRTYITMQQLVMGEATERVEKTGPSLERLTDDELDELIDIYDKAEGRTTVH